jgi:sulfite exporter TauE/SafE
LDRLADTGLWFPVVVAGAGFLTSLHCAGMCGPLILSVARTRSHLVGYHLSRLSTYTFAGLLAGWSGADLRTFAPPWFSTTVMAVIAALLILVGIANLKFRTLHLPLPPFLRVIQRKVFALRLRAPLLAASLTGALSIFLPCGHLYGFIGAAVATGSATKGGFLMATFVLSTWPVLFFGLGSFQNLLSYSSKFRLSGVMFIIAGMMSIASFALRAESKQDASKPPDAAAQCP